MSHEFFPETLRRQPSAGETTFHEGDHGRHMYAVRSGWVEFRQKNAQGESQFLRRIGVGRLFGEIALSEDVPRTADAIAVEDGSEPVEIDHAPESLARETRALFDSVSHGNSLSYISKGSAPKPVAGARGKPGEAK